MSAEKERGVLSELQEDGTEVIKEGGPAWRQLFRLGESCDCLQLQLYTILIEVVPDSFFTGGTVQKMLFLEVSCIMNFDISLSQQCHKCA